MNTKPIVIEEKNNEVEKALGLARKTRAEALVLGDTFEELQKRTKIEVEIPIFYPLIGLSRDEIDEKVTFLFGDGS